MAAAGSTVEAVTAWSMELAQLHRRIAPRFARAEPRQRALAYLQGLLSPVERKNGWQLAEEAGEVSPDGMQRLLNTAHWDADAVRDDLVVYVREHLGEPGAILVIDETGFLKKGTQSVGVQRQYSGTAGRRENCQMGVFVAYSTTAGHVLVDRDLYLPASWTDDPERCRAAGVPEGTPFATKPVLAQQMVARLFAAGLPASWVTGDEAYGGSATLRPWLEAEGHAYVLAIASNDGVDLPWRNAVYHVSAREVADHAVTAWQRLSAGNGAKGPRWYDWGLVTLAPPDRPGWKRWLLIRRSLDVSHERAYYLVYAPQETLFETLVAVAGRRWTIEESFELAKGEVGLDHYEVRHWVGWYRHMTLAMLALAYLAVIRAQQHAQQASDAKGGTWIPTSYR